MTTWNYRIVRYRDNKGFGLHEVFYDDDGLPWTMTEDPVGFDCGVEEGPEGIRELLDAAMRDVGLHPVLDEPETWPGQAP